MFKVYKLSTLKRVGPKYNKDLKSNDDGKNLIENLNNMCSGCHVFKFRQGVGSATAFSSVIGCHGIISLWKHTVDTYYLFKKHNSYSAKGRLFPPLQFLELL